MGLFQKLYYQYNESYPTIIYLFNVNKGNTRKRCDICSELTVKT